MSKYYMFIDFEFLPWKKKNEDQIRDVLSSGYIICEWPSFDISSKARCSDTPLSINLSSQMCRPLWQRECYDRIMQCMKKVPEKRENLLTELFSTTFLGSSRRSYEHSVDPSKVVDQLISESLTIIVWNRVQDIEILRALLQERYSDIKICNVSCQRESKTSKNFVLTLL
jgi:hypothetical protein